MDEKDFFDIDDMLFDPFSEERIFWYVMTDPYEDEDDED